MTPTEDNAEARKARADRLREEIARLKSRPPGAAAAPPGETGQESAREFVERRGRELAEHEKSKGDQ
jgi:hypothetical protein